MSESTTKETEQNSLNIVSGVIEFLIGIFLVLLSSQKILDTDGDNHFFNLLIWTLAGVILFYGINRIFLVPRKEFINPPTRENLVLEKIFQKFPWFFVILFLVIFGSIFIKDPKIRQWPFAIPIAVYVFLELIYLAYANFSPRGYLYAVLFSWMIIDQAFQIVELPVTLDGINLLVSGILLIVVGLFVFLRFLIRNPIPKEATLSTIEDPR